MKRGAETVFVCSNCGNEFSKWAGQCSACGEWNTLREITSTGFRKTQNSKSGSKSGKIKAGKESVNLSKIKITQESGRWQTGIGELDRVLGAGIVPGSVILFAGEPGIGKSTLLTQLIGKSGGLYVAGEESAEQVALRVNRLKLDPKNFEVLETNAIEEVESYFARTQNVFKIMVVDSIQTITAEISQFTGIGVGNFGSVNQIREVTYRLIQLAKEKKMAVIIVGHVTKEGEIAGPKVLEHMVDTVLYFEGDKSGELRILRASKNRFGSTEEVGVFKMGEKGLAEVGSEEINLITSKVDKIGSAITVVMEGSRPMMVEIQALVTESFSSMPKRIFSGLDYNRGELLAAVVQKTIGVPLYKYDVFVSVAGGMRLLDTASDLAVVAAIYSSYKEKSMGPKVYVGEVSLLGEIRKVRQMERRQKEAGAMGREVATMYSIKELKK
ncbi:DNA repair protein RadA [Candidatus Shapirobacteria bacterium CG_4_10_14_0_2_um_filter_40_12]|uniref:DNA repair protein RadA n=2 Tax=Candidatus Shapironibacteriota TaxID=1752721 RepID=A0A2M7TTW8_9BACT|nr:MAG: DNA repair protein RadA [Candidatus Shapirobacteria bacterium CG_4_10_14_0_2_um_filter_40_12]